MGALFWRLKSIPAASLNSEVTWISWWPDGPERAQRAELSRVLCGPTGTSHRHMPVDVFFSTL